LGRKTTKKVECTKKITHLQKAISHIQAHKITTNHIVYLTSNKTLQQKISKINNRLLSPTMCIANEYTIINSIYVTIKQYPSITIQYIKQNNSQHSEQLAQCNKLAQQAQHFNPTTHCIANTIQLSLDDLSMNRDRL
jgi:hypothetical protein